MCLSSEIVLFSGVLFQQTAGPDCDTDGADVAPGASLIREALGWINVGYTPDTTLQPHASTLQPHVSTLQPYTSTLQPCASTLQPYPQPLPCVQVSFMIGTTLTILWQLGKNVSFRAQKLAQAGAGLMGSETLVAGGGAQRVHAGTVASQGREGPDGRLSTYGRQEGGAGHFLLDRNKGGGPITDEELASAKAEAAAKDDVWSAAAEGARPSLLQPATLYMH